MILRQADNSSTLGLYGVYVEVTKCDLAGFSDNCDMQHDSNMKGKEQMVKSNINDGVMSVFLLCFHRVNCNLCLERNHSGTFLSPQ